MKKIFLSLTLLCFASPAFAMAHNGAPVTGLWSLIVRISVEVECMFETTLLALQLLLTGQWFALAHLDGICATMVNSAFFSSAWTAVATTLAMTILTLMPAFLALRWIMRHIKTTSNPGSLHPA